MHQANSVLFFSTLESLILTPAKKNPRSATLNVTSLSSDLCIQVLISDENLKQKFAQNLRIHCKQPYTPGLKDYDFFAPA